MLKLPINAGDNEFISLGLVHTIDLIERSGLKKDYDLVMERLNHNIDSALFHLSSYGVTKADIASAVRQAFLRKE
jgi:hypothetical protein